MIIKNAKIFSSDYSFSLGELHTSGARISNKSSDSVEIDAEGLYAIPGLIDTHFHGAMGVDFCDAKIESIKSIAKYEAMNGVTSLCPATLTLPTEELTEICSVGAEYEPAEDESDLIGIHLEGPFVSIDKIGAQNPKFVRVPSLSDFEKWYNASQGLVKMISLAPEKDGAMEFIASVKDRVLCSIAHTTASYDIANAAIKTGAKHITHLYNAMPGFHHREPSVIGAAFDNADCFAELIVDNVHIHPAVVRATLKMFGDDRIIFVSDSMMATGLTDGDYSLGGLDVKVEGKHALLKNGSIAGSTTNLMNCVKTAVKEMDLSLESAVKCASYNPAKALGVENDYGSLAERRYANIVLLNKDLDIEYVVLRGNIIYKK